MPQWWIFIWSMLDILHISQDLPASFTISDLLISHKFGRLFYFVLIFFSKCWKHFDIINDQNFNIEIQIQF